MAPSLLSEDWITAYQEEWNQNERAMSGTTGLDAVIELAVTDIDGRPPVHFRIRGEDGHSDYAGPVLPGVDATFRLSADTETWRRVGHGEIGVKRAVAGPIKMQGSMMTAMKFFSGLEAALLQFGTVPTEEWS